MENDDICNMNIVAKRLGPLLIAVCLSKMMHCPKCYLKQACDLEVSSFFFKCPVESNTMNWEENVSIF